jgi:hypothetical protein
MYVPTPTHIKGVLHVPFLFFFFTDNDDFADCPGGDYRTTTLTQSTNWLYIPPWPH